MLQSANDLYPICRSIIGDGVRETLARNHREVPVRVEEVPSRTKVFDWDVPDEGNITDAYNEGPGGDRVLAFKDRKYYRVVEALWVEIGRCILVSAPHEPVSRGHGFVAA